MSEWRRAPLSEVSSVFNGKTPPKSEQRDRGHAVLKIKDVNELGRFRGTFRSFVDPAFARKFAAATIQTGDTLILNAAHNAAYVASKTYRAEEPTAGAVATGEWLIVRADRSVLDPAFVHHWVNTRGTRRALSYLVKGIHLYPKDVQQLAIPLPPLAEQRRIADILDQADALRAKRRGFLAGLDRLVESNFKLMFGNPVTNDRHLPVVPIGEVTACIVPGRDKPKSFTGSIPWVTTEHLVPRGVTDGSRSTLGLTAEEVAEVRARIIPEGSVILCCVGNLGTTSLVGRPMVVNQQLHTYQCGPKVNNRFLMHYLPYMEGYMRAKASATTVPYMNMTVCNSIPIMLPSRESQDEFAATVIEIEALKNRGRGSLVELDTLFASLQHRAFRGEL